MVVHRVKYLWARSRWTRCLEEREQVKADMECNVLGMAREAALWKKRQDLAKTPSKQAYASKQHHMWENRSQQSAREFKEVANIQIRYDPIL